MEPQEIEKMIDEKIRKAMMFGQPKYGDTPTDANQLTPKKFVSSFVGAAIASSITSGLPAGANTQIQYNNNGAFGASSVFGWDNANTTLNLGVTPLGGGPQTLIKADQLRITTTSSVVSGGVIISTSTGSQISGDITLQTGQMFDDSNTLGFIRLNNTVHLVGQSGGFVALPFCVGTPVGTPFYGASMIYDTSANKIWIYNGSWRSVAVT